jgi:hypothetical protein
MLHHLHSLHFLVIFPKPIFPNTSLSQTLALLQQISDGNTLKKITLECQYRHRSYTYSSLAKWWQPLDTALSAMGSGEPLFGRLKEVEIVLSVNDISAPDIPRLLMKQKELLPSVEARGVMISVRLDKGHGERELLGWLRQM